MACNGYDDVLDLKTGELFELRDARGATLRVTRGTLWVTQDRDARDVVLRAGDVWTVERDGLTLAEAQGDAVVCLVGSAPRRVLRAGAAPSLVERVTDWFETVSRTYARRFVPHI